MKELSQMLLVLVVLSMVSVSGHCQQTPMSIDPGGGTPPPDPVTTITVSTNTCGEKTLTRSGTPPLGVLWYWQPAPGGTNKDNYSNTYIESREGTRIIAVRAFKPSNNTWSSGEVYKTVTVNLYPAGPSTPTVSDQCGQSIITRGTPPSGATWYWEDTNSNGTSTGNSATTYTAIASGTYYLRAGTSAGCWSSSVGATVNFRPVPATPPNPTSSGNSCGPVTISFNGSPGTNTVWYWQTTAGGTSTVLGSASSRVVSSSGSYFLSAYNTSSGCWSSASGQVSVTVNPYPQIPSTPAVSDQCGQSIITRGTPPSGTTWYWEDNNPDGTSTGNSSETYTATASGTYYLRARTSAGCWGISAGAEVNFRPAPVTPPNPTSSGNSCGPVTLSFSGSPGANTLWYWQTVDGGTSTTLGSASTHIVNASATYFLSAYNTSSECWSAGSGQVPVTVNPIPPAPSAPTVSNQCGSSILTYNNSSGDTWYWQDTDPDGTSVSNFASTYPANASGTYYLRARSGAGCWSNSTGTAVSVLSKPATPPAPLTTGNTCGAVTLSFNGTPPANVRWYWQTTANGTSTSEGYATPKVLTTSGTWYLNAYNSVSGCWSDLSSGAVPVTYNPAVGSPSVTGATREEPGIVQLSAAVGTNGTGIKWYSGDSGGTPLAETQNYSAVVSTTTTFYASSFNASTGCESGRVAVTATVYPKPVIAYTSLYVVMGNSVTLSVPNNSYTTYSWTRDGATAGTTASITTTQPGVYTVSVTKSGMTGTGMAQAVTISIADMNSITVTNVRKQDVTLASAIATLGADELSITTGYSGGLGNPIQTIISKASPLQKDLVVPIAYDVMGRQLNSYLPYVSTADNSVFRGHALDNGGYSGSEQYQFYQTADKVAHDAQPFATTEVEASPFGRVLAQTPVGNDWHVSQKKVTRQYLLSRSTDGVRIWSIAGGLPVSTAVYGDYELFLSETTDENGNGLKTWTDKLGRTILKAVQSNATTWLKTYYIYDDKGRLAFTLSPEGTRAANFSPDQTFLDQWAFQYKYDALDRLVEYKAPAGGWMYAVYDVLNRPVMTQNADQRSRSEWAFIKYDVLGRPVVTGSKVIPSSTRSSVQSSVDGQTYNFELTTNSSVWIYP